MMTDGVKTNFEFDRPKNFRNWLGQNRMRFNLFRYKRKTDLAIEEILESKRVVFGPFIGELGHLLAHNLPLISYLHSQNVQIEFVGFKRFLPFLINSEGEKMYSKFHELRDFSGEFQIWCNTSEQLPDDVAQRISELETYAEQEQIPLFWLNNEAEYWTYYRKWLMRSAYRKTYKFKDFELPDDGKKKAAVFVRSKPPINAEKFKANGPIWDYKEMVKALEPDYDQIDLIGIPTYSVEGMDDISPKVNWKVSLNNQEMLFIVANANVVITPHSGAMYLAAYTNTPFVIIYEGIQSYDEIGDIHSTLAFLKSLNFEGDLTYAFSNIDLKNKLKKLHETT